MQLTDHFHLAEFLRSQTAARMGRPIVPTDQQVENIRRLCRLVLEPVRVELGRSITVTSGLRPAWLNQAIGGSAKSAHLEGLAADVIVDGLDPVSFARWIRNRRIAVDQCIVEFGQWTHLSIAAIGAGRNEFLTASAHQGVTSYSRGV